MDFLCEESGTSMLLVLFLARSSGSIVLYKKSLSWRWIPYIWPKQGGAAENAGKVRKHRSIPIHAEGSSPVFAAGRNRGRATSPLLPADAHLQYTAARPAAAASTAVGIRQVRLEKSYTPYLQTVSIVDLNSWAVPMNPPEILYNMNFEARWTYSPYRGRSAGQGSTSKEDSAIKKKKYGHAAIDFLCEKSGNSMLLVLFLGRSSGSIVLYKKGHSWRSVPYIWPKQGELLKQHERLSCYFLHAKLTRCKSER